jgi:hypothetical protein
MSEFILSYARRAGAFVLGLVLATGIAMAQTTTSNIVFPEEPDRVIALDDGREIHEYKATVVSVRGNRLTVRYGNGERYTYDVPTDYRFDVDGRKVRTRDLGRGTELTAYVTVHEDAHHELVSIDESSGTAAVVSTVTPEPVADTETQTLPSTAGPMPLVGLFGVLSLGLGFLVFAVRRRLG